MKVNKNMVDQKTLISTEQFRNGKNTRFGNRLLSWTRSKVHSSPQDNRPTHIQLLNWELPSTPNSARISPKTLHSRPTISCAHNYTYSTHLNAGNCVIVNFFDINLLPLIQSDTRVSLKSSLQFPISILCLLRSYLPDRTAQIRIASILSTPFLISAGVPQGSPISSMIICSSLFCSYIPKSNSLHTHQLNMQTKLLQPTLLLGGLFMMRGR